MKKLKDWKTKQNIIKILKMYPIVLGCFFAIGALGIYVNHYEPIEDTIGKIMLSIIVFGGFALILRAMATRWEKFTSKKHIIGIACSLVLSAGYYFTLDFDNSWTVIRTLIIIFAQALLFISLPYIKDDDRSEHFVNLAIGRFVISGLLYGIAYGGIAGILFALEELFGLSISYKAYADVSIILGTTFLPMLWLHGLNYEVEPSTKKLYKVLLSYVCIPLLFVYTLVVYGYIVKIAFNSFILPSSQISNLVLWYSLVSMAVIYLARPYADNAITKVFFKWYPIVSILPIGIMFAAIFMRINQYGITKSRYFLLLGGIWLTMMFGYLIYSRFAKKKKLNIILPISLAVIALISIVEPISAETISRKSQVNRLEDVVANYITGDQLNIDDMSKEEQIQAQDILKYLRNNHEGYGIYDDEFEDNIDFITVKQAGKILELPLYNYETGWGERPYLYASNTGKDGYSSAPIDIQGYRYLIPLDTYIEDEQAIEYNEYSIEISQERDGDDIVDFYITIYIDSEVFKEISLVECYGEKMLKKKDQFGEDSSDFIYESEDKSFKLILTEVNYWHTDYISFVHISAQLLLK